MKKLSLQQWANIFKVVAVIIFIAIILSVSGCSSACARQHRYWNTHRCV